MITPLFLLGEAGTALAFIVYQHWRSDDRGRHGRMQAIIIRACDGTCWCSPSSASSLRASSVGRIAESVDGIVEIRAHEPLDYERAEISSRLGKIFRIRFEFYQRKFLIKFLNNFLSQVTPFLFYSVGGYS